MSLFQHVPHPHVKARSQQGPVTLYDERLSRNDRIAAWATQKFGTMPMTYLFMLYGALGAVFTALQAVLLYWSNWVQLWSLPLIMVGGIVLGRAQERRNIQAFQDTEAILHGQQQMAEHQNVQDELLIAMATKLGVPVPAEPSGARGEVP